MDLGSKKYMFHTQNDNIKLKRGRNGNCKRLIIECGRKVVD